MQSIESNNIRSFINACDEFIEGKFILADIKIAKILRSVSICAPIYDLIAESLINYDFKKEFEEIKKKNELEGRNCLTLPENIEEIIPFVFSLLVDIDSKQINFNEFLSTQFPIQNTQTEEYESFAKNLIIPFKNAIIKALDSIFDEQDDYEKENVTLNYDKKLIEKHLDKFKNKLNNQQDDISQDEIDLLFNSLTRTSMVLLDKTILLKNEYKKSNVEILAEALLEACRLKNIKITVALVMALNDIAGKEKVLKDEVNEINSICYAFYK